MTRGYGGIRRIGASVQARARPMRRRFFSSEPGRTAKCTCPSWSTATTRTTARACLKRAEQLFVSGDFGRGGTVLGRGAEHGLPGGCGRTVLAGRCR